MLFSKVSVVRRCFLTYRVRHRVREFCLYLKVTSRDWPAMSSLNLGLVSVQAL